MSLPRNRLDLCVSILIVVASTGACSKMADYETPSPNADRQFVSTVAVIHLNQLGISRVVAEGAGSNAVKAYAGMLGSYHSVAGEELRRTADTINLEVPTQPDAEHQAVAQRLARLSGTALDTAYLAAQIDEHRKAIALFEAELKVGSSPAVLRYTGKHLPELLIHLGMADSLLRELR
jgi:putative membrane protein